MSELTNFLSSQQEKNLTDKEGSSSFSWKDICNYSDSPLKQNVILINIYSSKLSIVLIDIHSGIFSKRREAAHIQIFVSKF